MVYEVVFRRREETGVGPGITRIKYKGVRRVSTDNENGVTFIGSKNEVLAFIPNEVLLYVEKTEWLNPTN